MLTSTCEFDDILLTPEFLADPYPVYHRMRAEAPVYWSERYHAWMLTRYAHVKSTLVDPRLKSRSRIAAILSQLPQSATLEFKPLSDHMTKWLAFTDAPDHTRLRTLVDKAFTPRLIANLR